MKERETVLVFLCLLLYVDGVKVSESEKQRTSEDCVPVKNLSTQGISG